ncbi:MAG: hypothetical protein HN842_00600 [Gammaproteobacteria bacterium]|jgi:hypothetical protein|nr:hypothetical protein [Gammaproteobacteria bacterium]MBT7306681.1 hypothetical protein [Gammaproteobacteria bacterium]
MAQINAEKSPEACKAGKWPHELFVLNLIFFHLLAVPAGLAFGLGYWGLLVPILSSSGLLFYYQSRISHFSHSTNEWDRTHWEQGLRRFRWLYLGYALVALLIGLIRLFVDPTSIAFVALTRVAVMPAIILVLVTFVMSTAAIGRAGNGEL